MRWLFVLVGFLFVMSGCTGGYSDELLEVERVMMNDDPATALKMLDSMPADKWKSRDDRALYGLLHTELRIKNYLPVENDSLIDGAIRYFWHNDDKEHLTDGYLYKGRLEFEKSNYHDAMEADLMALELSESLSDTLRMARSHEFMADVYNHVINGEKTLIHRRIAAELYEKCGKRLNYYYALVETSHAYESCGYEEKAIELLDSIKPMIDEPICTPILKEYHLESYVLPLFYLGRYDEAKSKVKEIEAMGEDYLLAKELNVMSVIYSYEAKIDSAMMYADLCEKKCVNYFDSIQLIDAKLELARVKKNYDDIISFTKMFDTLQRKAVWRALNESVDDVQADYYKKQNRITHLKERKTRFMAVFIGFLSIIVILISYLIFRNRLYKKRILIDRKFAEIYELTRKMNSIEQQKEELSRQILLGNDRADSLEETVQEKSSEIGKMSVMVDELFKKQFMVLNKLCDEYFEKHDSDKVRVALYSELEKIVLEMKSEDSLKKLVDGVNEYKGGIIDKLRGELPWLGEKDIIFISLIYADFSPRTICLFMGYKLSNYYAKRKRLTARIEVSDAPDKELFLGLIR